MTPTFDDFGGDESAWSDYCDERAEAEELERDEEEADMTWDYDPDADENWGESALTVGERNR